MSMRRRRLGAFGEAVAAQHLERAGYRILERNFSCPAGEIDIVAANGYTLVLVEVRTRRGDRFGTPEESITRRKQAKLREVAETYVSEHGYLGDWRIDVVAVNVDKSGRVIRCELIRNAIQG